MSKLTETVIVHGHLDLKKETVDLISTMSPYGDISIEKGKWKLFMVAKVAPEIQTWNIEDTLYIQENEEPKILKQIMGINFPILRKIHLWGNNIESLEVLVRISIPNLQVLQFCDNHIASFRPFRKVCFPKLRYLEFYNNKCQELEAFQAMWAPDLEEFILEMYDNNTKMCETLNWLFKVESQKMRQIWAKSKKRRLGSRQEEAIKSKYPNINLFSYED